MLVKLELYGLSCGACLKAIRRALEGVGAKILDINMREATVEIYDDDVEKLVKAVEDAGYEAKIKS
ncbi:MAG: heavy-metal-associated domain-containing protein [Archaeoglobaceae archaeon]|nr:heavy-metal-associated domain-containing protein [Archaeoglobaceae archaeon]MCX8152584.1 heavy-metal-associated domain-containing protein [Archaeoglobaceae archaeon]MDW8014134.1 heavy metal-associated domain-containing protein [Archaeoglobaceae archaeon]